MGSETKGYGMEELRAAVRALDLCNETFLDRFSPEELLTLWRMWRASEWDILPSQWAERQVQDALNGIVPRWTDDEKPIYTTKESDHGRA